MKRRRQKARRRAAPVAKRQDRAKLFSRRALLLGGVQGVAAITLFGRLYYLSIVNGKDYRTLAEQNRVSLRLLAPDRGRILDRTGFALATNRRDYRVFLIPEQVTDPEATLARLNRILPLSERRIAQLIRQIRRQRGFVPLTVREHLDWRSFARVNVESADLPGIVPDVGTTRWYPEGADLAQVVGYVGAPGPDEIGQSRFLQLPGVKTGKRGIEKAYEAQLRGMAGSARVEVNARGRIIRQLASEPAQMGRDISLTIDRDLQRIATARLGEESAGVVALDIQSGDVLIHASTPSYDPNELNLGISRENWQALLDDPRTPLVNKCISGQYPPGSTFKMLVLLAALERGLVDPEETVTCWGRYPFGDRVFHCWRRQGHGPVNMIEALAKSCDTYFYELASLMEIGWVADIARRFGLGQSFDLDLPGESQGLVPDPAWKLAATGRPWVQGDTLNVCIGQGALLATPLQLAVMTARLANGGKAVTPHLVHALDGVPVPRAPAPDMGLNPKHLALIYEGMQAVMAQGGTAFPSRLRDPGLTMAGKTGTAQVRRITDADRAADVQQEDKPWAERHHAWFVAYAPAVQPRYALSVLVEHGGGGASAAAPVARDIVKAILERDRARSDTLVQRA